jgi:hypothetical protein
MEALKPLAAMLEQIYNQPACLLIVLAVNVVVFMWEGVPWLPSRLIIVIGPALGGFLYPQFASTGSVPYDVPNPLAVLVVNGMVSGLLAVAIHSMIVTFLRKKFGWPPEAGKPTPDHNNKNEHEEQAQDPSS